MEANQNRLEGRARNGSRRLCPRENRDSGFSFFVSPCGPFYNYICCVYLPEVNVNEAETETTKPPASPVLATLQPQLSADSSRTVEGSREQESTLPSYFGMSCAHARSCRPLEAKEAFSCGHCVHLRRDYPDRKCSRRVAAVGTDKLCACLFRVKALCFGRMETFSNSSVSAQSRPPWSYRESHQRQCHISECQSVVTVHGI